MSEKYSQHGTSQIEYLKVKPQILYSTVLQANMIRLLTFSKPVIIQIPITNKVTGFRKSKVTKDYIYNIPEIKIETCRHRASNVITQIFLARTVAIPQRNFTQSHDTMILQAKN